MLVVDPHRLGLHSAMLSFEVLISNQHTTRSPREISLGMLKQVGEPVRQVPSRVVVTSLFDTRL